MATINLRNLPSDLVRQAKAHAALGGTTLRGMIQGILEKVVAGSPVAEMEVAAQSQPERGSRTAKAYEDHKVEADRKMESVLRPGPKASLRPLSGPTPPPRPTPPPTPEQVISIGPVQPLVEDMEVVEVRPPETPPEPVPEITSWDDQPLMPSKSLQGWDEASTIESEPQSESKETS